MCCSKISHHEEAEDVAYAQAAAASGCGVGALEDCEGPCLALHATAATLNSEALVLFSTRGQRERARVRESPEEVDLGSYTQPLRTLLLNSWLRITPGGPAWPE